MSKSHAKLKANVIFRKYALKALPNTIMQPRLLIGTLLDNRLVKVPGSDRRRECNFSFSRPCPFQAIFLSGTGKVPGGKRGERDFPFSRLD